MDKPFKQPPKKKRKKNKRIVINNGCMYSQRCLYYPDCDRGDSCWYQHLEYESVVNEKKQKLLQKANQIVTPNHKLLSQIYQQIHSNDNNSTVNVESDILYELANKLSTSNLFKILQIGSKDIFLFKTKTNETTAAVTSNDDKINIDNIGDTKVIDILDVVQHYECKLDELAIDIWRYEDMHELSFAICSWLPSNDELMTLDLSYFNYGFQQHDFNNICEKVRDNLPFIKIFAISGRSQNQSMIESMYDIIRTTTSLTEIKLKLLFDTNDFGGGGCIALDTKLLIDGLFENEMYLESQIKQIQNSLKNNNLYGVCIDKIIDFCFGNDVLDKELKLSVNLNIYGTRNYDDFNGDTLNVWTFNERFKKLKTERQVNKSTLKRQISFKSSMCVS